MYISANLLRWTGKWKDPTALIHICDKPVIYFGDTFGLHGFLFFSAIIISCGRVWHWISFVGLLHWIGICRGRLKVIFGGNLKRAGTSIWKGGLPFCFASGAGKDNLFAVAGWISLICFKLYIPTWKLAEECARLPNRCIRKWEKCIFHFFRYNLKNMQKSFAVFSCAQLYISVSDSWLVYSV